MTLRKERSYHLKFHFPCAKQVHARTSGNYWIIWTDHFTFSLKVIASFDTPPPQQWQIVSSNFFAHSLRKVIRWQTERRSWEHQLMRKYHCTADILFILFGFSCFANVELAKDLPVWSNPNQSNRISAVQWVLSASSVLLYSIHTGTFYAVG